MIFLKKPTLLQKDECLLSPVLYCSTKNKDWGVWSTALFFVQSSKRSLLMMLSLFRSQLSVIDFGSLIDSHLLMKNLVNPGLQMRVGRAPFVKQGRFDHIWRKMSVKDSFTHSLLQNWTLSLVILWLDLEQIATESFCANLLVLCP